MQHDHSHDNYDEGANRALEAIKAGGQHMLAHIRTRISEVLDDLDSGDFRGAYDHLGEASSMVAPLASAQNSLAVADGSVLMVARDLHQGMVLVDMGEISEIEVTNCTAQKCDGHVKVKIGEHEADYRGNTKLYVTAESVRASGA